MSPKPLTSAQIRAARALIRWSALQLAEQTAVGVTTIRRAELTASETKLTRVNDQAIRRVLEAAGVEFIDANGGGPGVRLKKSHDATERQFMTRKSHKTLLPSDTSDEFHAARKGFKLRPTNLQSIFGKHVQAEMRNGSVERSVRN